MTDAVVVGSGPNGLAGALVLARAGLSVRVVEASDRVGGGAQSRESTLPGLIHDESSGFHPFGTVSALAREFDLAGAGLELRWPEVQFSHPLDGGGGSALWRSVEETSSRLGADAATWTRVFGPLTERFDTIAEEFLQPVLHLPRHPVHLARFGAYAGQPAALLVRRFATEEARALLAGSVAHAFRPFGSLASAAIGVALTTAAHRFGWPVARGGTGAITAAVLRRATELGVVVETGRAVRDLGDLDGEGGRPDVVLLDTTPAAAAAILGPRLPARVGRAYHRFRGGPGAFKVDYAVEGGVPWTHEPSRRAGTVHLGGTAAEVAATEAEVAAGRMPRRPFVLVGQQYVADPSRSRDGIDPLYAYAHVPAGFAGDPAAATAAVTAQIERFAPGFGDRIRAVHVRSTADLSRDNANLVGGDIVGGANDVAQLLFRPRATLRPYATGVPGVYLCSASTPPGAGAHGMCGYHAARAALADLSR